MCPSHGWTAAAAALTTLASIPLAGQGQDQHEPIWRNRTAGKILAFHITPARDVLVLTDSGLSARDLATGQTRWVRPEVTGYWVVGPTSSIVRAADGREAMLDLENGATRWSFDRLPVSRGRPVPLRELGMLLVYGETPESRLTVLAVGVESGTVYWRQDSLFADRDLMPYATRITLAAKQPGVLDPDSSLVLYPSRGGPIRLDLRSGQLLWRTNQLRGMTPPSVADGYPRMTGDSDLLFVPHEKSLFALNRHTGMAAWYHTEDFPRRLSQVQLTARGLVVSGYFAARRLDLAYNKDQDLGAFIDLLDRETGRSLWARQFRDEGASSRFLVRNDTICVVLGDRFLALDLATGASRTIAKVKFQSGEHVWNLDTLPEGFLLSSGQDITFLSPGGEQRYQRFYRAPDPSVFEGILSPAAGLSYPLTAGLLYGGPSGPLRYEASYSPPGKVPALSARLAAMASAEQFLYVYTAQADSAGHEGLSLLRIAKVDGQETGRVWLNERRPDYRLDPATGTVVLRKGDSELIAYRF